MNPNTIRNAILVASLTCAVGACSGGGADAGFGGNALPAAAQAMADLPDGAVAFIDDDDMMASAIGARLRSIAGKTGVAFADLPDRGDLVGYPQERVVRRAGPYTWHRADVSEAHALRAVVDGTLTLTAPSGQPLRFEYERHVEHDSGDWTWIGRAVGGGPAQEAILTFGPTAVFGTISQPGQEPLKLTMEDGVSWLVETDRAARRAQSRESGRYDRPDFLLPPEIEIVQGLRAQAAAIAGASVAAGSTVDVVVGYTPGFATAMGGTAGAVSRLNFLVILTNESYVNSKVDAEVRLVHAMQVAYSDATSNSDALHALTGSDGSPPDPAQIDPALQPLHSARDQYGADLVSLVRDFQHPEAVNCGVAWLIGGGQTFVHTGYAPFGMSVVSDGSDGGFFCEDTTFAHELGHNMGLAHDVDTAKGDDGILDQDDYGRYVDSFGYRTGPAQGSFYTVMAYSDDQEHGYLVFSNPDVLCEGFPCGVAGEADNARTLRDMIPVIGGFRATVVQPEPDIVAGDLNGDGRSDVIWRNVDSGYNTIWLSANSATGQAMSGVGGQSWRIVGNGDYNGDGKADVLWRNVSTGTNVIWRSGNSSDTQAVRTLVGADWEVAGDGDFNGDGRSDILWRHAGIGYNTIWLSANSATGQAMSGVGPAWTIVGTGDYNGDGRSDVMWRHPGSGTNVIWRGADSNSTQAVRTLAGDWEVAGDGDFNGDGNSDILWRHAGIGYNTIWLSGNSATGQAMTGVGPSWFIAGTGDYDGDGRSDVLWRSHQTGSNVIWKGANSATTQAVARLYGSSWIVAP